MSLLPSLAHGAVDCSAAKLKEVLEPLSATKSSVSVQCNLNLKSYDVVTKKIVVYGSNASGITINCNGATIGSDTVSPSRMVLQIASQKVTDPSTGQVQWRRPENVTVKNCVIKGRAGVSGMASADLRVSSYTAGHTGRAQAAAPKNIQFENMTMIGQNIIPLYVYPGATYVSVRNSTFTGVSNSVTVYLDAESAHHTIKDNTFRTRTRREHLAVDGSAYNKIIGNKFFLDYLGGIFLYRNCGEAGVVRHQTPSQNQILNNYFDFGNSTGYNGVTPAIWVASRNGNRDYCSHDNGYPVGSSVNNNDLARYNVISQNQIRHYSAAEMIRVNASPNTLNANETVSNEISRPAACYLDSALPTNFFASGTTTRYVMADGEPTCNGRSYKCNDGEIISASISCANTPLPIEVPFSCKADNNNSGCRGVVTCPSRKNLLAVRAGCNLEFGLVSQSRLASVPWNQVEVVRASDYINAGFCFVADAEISSGSSAINIGSQQNSFEYSCREFDSNGGECHVFGTALCL